MQLMMTRGKHPPSPGRQLSCMVLVRETWQEAGREDAAASARDDKWSQEGKEVGGEARAEGHNFIMNSCLFRADCPQICH